MRTVSLTSRNIRSTALGIGTADLFRLPSRREREQVLAAAFEAGIRHVDTAPMYGLGIAEDEVGAFARGRRHELTIATKFGIAPTRASLLMARVQGPLRAVLAASPGARDRARSAAAGPNSGLAGRVLYTALGYGPDAARTSLRRSLRALGTDYVDILLLHDPLPGSLVSDDTKAALDSLVAEGSIRAWGVAGEVSPTIAVARALMPAELVLQLRGDALDPTDVQPLGAAPQDVPSPALILFGVIGRALADIRRHLAARPEQSRAWNERLGVDVADDGVLGLLLLRDALAHNRDGVVLYSTTRVERLRAAAGVAAEPVDGAVVTAFRDALAGLAVTRSTTEA